MSALDKLPWTKLALAADECAQVFGLSKDRFLRTIARLPAFPQRVSLKPAAWKAGEVVEWRGANRFHARKKHDR